MSTIILADDVRAIFHDRELYVMASATPGCIDVYDDSDARRFTISTDIKARDLTELLRHADRARLDGIDIGKAGLQAALRNLLGAAAEPQEAPL